MGKRRGNNEGSVFRMADGTWAAEITFRDAGGKIKRPRRKAKTQAQARERLKELQKLVGEGVQVSRPSETVEAFSTEWLESAIKPTVRVKTFVGYESIIRVRVSPHIGQLKLAQVTPLRIQSLYTDLRATGLSERSLVHTHAVLNKLFRQATAWNLIARNPVASVRRPRADSSEMKVWTQGQVVSFLDATRMHRHYAIYVLAATTGMRQGEVLGLRWRDVDLAEKRLRVRQSLQRQSAGGLTFVLPKTNRSRRTIILSSRAITALGDHKRKQNEVRLKAGQRWIDNDLVFCGVLGQPLDPSHITHVFKDTSMAAGLPRIRFHDLRHTAATLLLSSGKHPKVVSDLLGHVGVAITLDTYSHLVPVLHEEAAAAMDLMLGA